MSLPFTKSQIERLGRRLVEQTPPAQADLDDLAVLLSSYDEALDVASNALRDLGYAPTGRLKNTGTILEKLRRHGGTWLKSIQDLAGLRVVIEGGLPDQDRVTEEVVQCFAECPKPPKKIDRRADPRQGYRAVHVIVFPQGMPVEVQIRTRPQHMWAELFEKLADLLGREIRYGEDWVLPGEREVAELRGFHPEVDAAIDGAASALAEAKGYFVGMIGTLLGLSANIGIIEENLDNPRLGSQELEAIRLGIDRSFDNLRPLIERLEPILAGVRVRADDVRAAAADSSPVRSNHD